MGAFYWHTHNSALIRWSLSLSALALLAGVRICGDYTLLMTLPFALMIIVV